MDRYRKIEKLGEGSCGVVYKAQNRETGAVVALKRIRLDREHDGIPSTAIREVALLKRLAHPNIVRLHDILYAEKKLTLIFEYLDLDLNKYIDMQNDRDIFTIKRLMHQLFLGLAHCHSHQILHRDLKPQNILINKEGELKLADFGLAHGFGAPLRSYSHDVVTLWYRAPDILLGSGHYSSSIDIWSVGCIFAELCTGKPLFPGSTVPDQLDKIFRILGTPDISTWPDLPNPDHTIPIHNPLGLANAIPDLDPLGLDLLARCLETNPDARITAEHALAHPFFASSQR